MRSSRPTPPTSTRTARSTRPAARRARTTVGTVGTFLGHLSLLYFLSALGTEALARAMGRRGGGDDDDDGALGWLQGIARESLSTAFNMIPVVREFGTAGVAFVFGDTETGV